LSESSKLSGSRAKAELYAALALTAADQLERAAARLEIEASRLAQAKAEEHRLRAREARALASELQSWLVADPGTDTRIRLTARLMDVRAAADEATRPKRSAAR
jgi:hypothetical protein